MSDVPETEGVAPAGEDPAADYIAARVDSFTNLALNYGEIGDAAVRAFALQIMEKLRDSIPSARRRGAVTPVPKRGG